METIIGIKEMKNEAQKNRCVIAPKKIRKQKNQKIHFNKVIENITRSIKQKIENNLKSRNYVKNRVIHVRHLDNPLLKRCDEKDLIINYGKINLSLKLKEILKMKYPNAKKEYNYDEMSDKTPMNSNAMTPQKKLLNKRIDNLVLKKISGRIIKNEVKNYLRVIKCGRYNRCKNNEYKKLRLRLYALKPKYERPKLDKDNMTDEEVDEDTDFHVNLKRSLTEPKNDLEFHKNSIRRNHEILKKMMKVIA